MLSFHSENKFGSAAEDTHCYVCPISNFQIMITNGGTMKCGGRCEDVKLQMGEYRIKTQIFTI
jgi:hypothetical protein